FNSRGSTTSRPFVESLLRTCDVLCLQEHWLHETAFQTLRFPGFAYVAKSSVDTSQRAPCDRGRNSGGVAIIHREGLARSVCSVSVASDRIIGVECVFADYTITIFCVYFPTSARHASDNDVFASCLGALLATIESASGHSR